MGLFLGNRCGKKNSILISRNIGCPRSIGNGFLIHQKKAKEESRVKMSKNKPEIIEPLETETVYYLKEMTDSWSYKGHWIIYSKNK